MSKKQKLDVACIEFHYAADGSVSVIHVTSAGARSRPWRVAEGFRKGDVLKINYGGDSGNYSIRESFN